MHKAMGLVSQVFDEEILGNLQGHIAVGHNRYSTTGASKIHNAQPVLVRGGLGALALAHNGNLVNTEELQTELMAVGVTFKSTTDSEALAELVACAPGTTWENKLLSCLPRARGAYSLVMATVDTLIGARDPLGIRPLCLGRLGNGWVLSSETCGLATVGAAFERDIAPGEIILIDDHGMCSRQMADWAGGRRAFCIFEHIYFARPDSDFGGRSVHQTRVRLGHQLAREHPVEADLVVAIPDSALPAAIGYARESGIPLSEGLVKNPYIGRTFIQPDQRMREASVRLKFNPLPGNLAGKRVAVIDDSVVRGNTIRQIVHRLRESGAIEVHMRITSPPMRHPCHLGVDTPTHEELVAHRLAVPEICHFIGADSLGYLGIEGLVQAVDGTSGFYCLACFDGDYPLAIAARSAKKLRLAVLASGNGTNLQAILDQSRLGRLHGEVVVVVSNHKSAYALQRAAQNRIPTLYFPLKPYLRDGRGREAYDADLAQAVAFYAPDLVVLAGWMHVLSEAFVRHFRGRVLNLHPALLPAFPGINAIQRAFEARMPVTGVTVHFVVDRTYDTGPIILQEPVEVQPGDTLESLTARIHGVEHRLLPQAIQLIAEGRVQCPLESEAASRHGGPNAALHPYRSPSDGRRR
jgi:amidophosphoribosyltransferase